MYFVYRMTTDNNLQYDLVTEGYYQKEMELQGDIYAQQNSAAMEKQIIGAKKEEGYLLRFPEGFDAEKIKGKVFLYRPSNKQLDFEISLELSPNEEREIPVFFAGSDQSEFTAIETVAGLRDELFSDWDERFGGRRGSRS